jgi:hypothetical protein
LGINRTKENELNESLNRKQKPKWSVGGAGPDDLTKVRLIVISDYPGIYESQYRYPMVDITETRNERKNNGLLYPWNAGAFLRKYLSHEFKLNTYDDCWFTNAVRCDPGKLSVIETTHMKPCIQHWLKNELLILDEHCPRSPILIAGTYAFRALNRIYSLPGDLQSLRRRSDLLLPNGRPYVCTINPATPARAMPKIESHSRLVKGRSIVQRNVWLPPIIGSPVWHYIEDLKCLKPLIQSS